MALLSYSAMCLLNHSFHFVKGFERAIKIQGTGNLQNSVNVRTILKKKNIDRHSGTHL